MPEIIDPTTNKPVTKSDLNEVKDDLKAYEKATLRWMRAQAVIAILAAMFVAWQAYEMNTSGVDTHALAVSASNQANAAEAQSRQAELQTKRMAESIVKTDALIKETAIQAKATNALAVQAKRSADVSEKSLASSQELFRMQERPWVGITDFRIVEFERSKLLKFDVRITNNGNSPALKIIHASAFHFNDRKVLGPQSDWSLEKDSEPIGVLAPNGTVNLHFAIPTDDRYEALANGTQWVYFFGEIKYTDKSGINGFTKWCLYMVTDQSNQPDLYRCQTYDDLQ
jgi:hypothetical protein